MRNQNKVISAVLIVAFATIFAVVMYHNTRFDSKATAFMAQGPRFTAVNGQELCERVAALERHVGLVPGPCNYIEEKFNVWDH